MSDDRHTPRCCADAEIETRSISVSRTLMQTNQITETSYAYYHKNGRAHCNIVQDDGNTRGTADRGDKSLLRHSQVTKVRLRFGQT